MKTLSTNSGETANVRRLVSLTFCFGAAAFFALAENSAADTNFCTRTANLLLDGCEAGVTSDSLIKQAVCLNTSDSDKRAECLSDLNDSRDEDAQLCQDQHQARLDLCNVFGEGRYDPDFTPGKFDDPKDPSHPNPYYPLAVGDHWKYVGGGEVNTVTVKDRTKLIDGVTCIVVRDIVRVDGFITESTNDWFAQAKDGTTWYCGEETAEFETFDGDDPVVPELITNEGSFKAGREGDKPGIIFEASPKKGDNYVEEASLENAEDNTEILTTNYEYGKSHELDRFVPRDLAEHFCPDDCVVTKNGSVLEPGVFERKYYAPGIGVFLEVELDSKTISQLVDCNFDDRCEDLPKPKADGGGD